MLPKNGLRNEAFVVDLSLGGVQGRSWEDSASACKGDSPYDEETFFAWRDLCLKTFRRSHVACSVGVDIVYNRRRIPQPGPYIFRIYEIFCSPLHRTVRQQVE